ncbi:MAG: sensor histidine kinase [Sulfitobacter sp.]
MGQSLLQNCNLFKRTRRIAVRLQLVFLVLSCVTAIAGITAVLRAKNILVAHSELTEFALPMLTLAQNTERNLSSMFLVLENIKSFRSVDELEKAKVEIAEKTERVRQNLKALRRFGVSGKVITDLDQRLNVAETSSVGVIQRQSVLVALHDDINETLKQLLVVQDTSQRLLDSLALDLTSQMGAVIQRPQSEFDLDTEPRNAQIDNLFVATLNVTTISFALNDVITLIQTQAQIHSTSTSTRSHLLIQAKLSDIINRVAQIPKSASRRELAKHISTLRDMVTKDAGIFSRLNSQQHFQQEFDANRATHLQLLPEISDMSTELVARTLREVDSTSKKLNWTIYQLIWLIVAAFVTVLITVCVTNQIVIVRQFNRRIQSLNHSVTAIAKGELDHPIPVSGHDELSDMARALSVFRDNSEELLRSNIELEKFAYVAAHDLRSPLQAIHDLSSWTIEDEETVLSEPAHEYLTLLQQRVERLKRLLNDLLSYGRVGQNEPDEEFINLQQLVNEQAHFADPHGHYNIRYQGFDTTVLAQLTPLQQIIGNLIHNAVKHHDKEVGSITITAGFEGRNLILVVADDGPGIDKRYQKRIFDLFQTLKPRDDVEGSGLGLAIVNKLISRKKGLIEVFSDPSKCRGTSFKVTLPLSQIATAALGQNQPRAA